MNKFNILELKALLEKTQVLVVPKSITLTYNHPVKALFWKQDTADITAYNAKLQLNGHDRFTEQPAMYFTGVQPYECGLKHVRQSGAPTVDAKNVYVFFLFKTWRTSTFWFM